jgi:hypothetical protein
LLLAELYSASITGRVATGVCTIGVALQLYLKSLPKASILEQDSADSINWQVQASSVAPMRQKHSPLISMPVEKVHTGLCWIGILDSPPREIYRGMRSDRISFTTG